MNGSSIRNLLALIIIGALFPLTGCPSPEKKEENIFLPLDSYSNPETYTNGGTNSTPVANAGADQNVTTGNLAMLNGSASSDPDGDLLTYSWMFLSKPAGSTATLWTPADIYPTFIADAVGTYEVRLIVNDGQADSVADTVIVTVAAVSWNNAPIADADIDQYVKTGALVALNGSWSGDVDGDPLTYSWSFTSTPAGSTAAFSDATGIYPTFTADKDGLYGVQLIVNDGKADSAPDAITVTAVTPVVVRVPDTGQTGDFTATAGEDSDYTINPPSYLINGDGTVTDAVTGLRWQQQDDGTARDWSAAMSFCSDLALAGFTDWRLPDSRELIGIVDYGTSSPAIDTAVFPNTRPAGYWSSTEYGLDTTYAWNIAFDLGYHDNKRISKTDTHYVRCVRGYQALPVLTDHQDGTVTDDTTTLMWQQNDDNIMRRWVEALPYCEGLTLAGHDDWRLPTVKELMSITDYRFWPFTINYDYFPSTLKLKGEPIPNYHTSTTMPANANQNMYEKFLIGMTAYGNKSGSTFVRCVRGGQ